MGLYFGNARLFRGNKTMLDNASFTQRLFGEMMMYFGSMYIQFKLYPEALWRNDDVFWINVHPA